ncbi:MAG TPA: AAA family ATPase [Acidimicrobiales bacterium]|nr:AAA family ATPase [Acidimicrobiales bacterium]
MRIVAVDLREFRSLKHAHLGLDGLVVLFGRNSSGKTTIIEGLREVLAGGERYRPDPFREPVDSVEADVWSELIGSELPNHPDAHLHRELFTGAMLPADDHSAWSFIDPDMGHELRGSSLETAQAVVAQCYSHLPGPGTLEDRQLLAEEIVRSRLFCSTAEATSLTVVPHLLTSAAQEAAKRICALGSAESQDPLLDDARQLSSRSTFIVAALGPGYYDTPGLRQSFGGCIDIDLEADGLDSEVGAYIEAIHDRLWSLPDDQSFFIPMVDPPQGERPHVSLNHDFWWPTRGSGSRDRYSHDRWLEIQAIEDLSIGFAESTSLDTAEFPLEWQRVRPSVVASARMLEAHANTVAPAFVSELGEIRVQILPPSLWHKESQRVRISFEENGDRHDLRVIGSGVARWASASLRLAGHELANGKRVVQVDGNEVCDDDMVSEAVREARRRPLDQTSVVLIGTPSTSAITYIVDEPEAHLHPKAILSVAEWMMRLVARGHQMVCATHHPALLSRLATSAQLVLVTKSDGVTSIRDVSSGLQSQLGKANAELGLSQGELLLLTRLALFVEGPYDKAVLEGMGGDLLASAGVRVFPLHGIDNAMALISSEVIDALGIRLGVLADNVEMANVRGNRPVSKEERAVARLRHEANQVGRRISPFGLRERDIVQYLDDDVCRSEAPIFPGWKAAVRAWRDSGRSPDFKRFVRDEYGLRLNRDDVFRLAVKCRDGGRVPPEISQLVSEVCARAASD